MPHVSPSLRKLAVALGLAALLTAAIAATAVSPAPAAGTKKHALNIPYVHNWVFRSTKLKRCVFIEASGSMTGNWQYLYGGGSPDKNSLNFTSMRLANPTVTATGWPITSTGCDSTKRWRMKADLSQGWFQSGCDLKVGVSVGFPWSVSASPSYSCGKNKVGHRTSTEGPAATTLSQFNSGYPIKFANTVGYANAGGVGFTGVITVRAHKSSASDAVRYPINVTFNK